MHYRISDLVAARLDGPFRIAFGLLWAVLIIGGILGIFGQHQQAPVGQPPYPGLGELVAWAIILSPVVLGLGFLYVAVHFIRKYW